MANIFEELLMSVDRLHTKNEIIMNKVENISFKQEEAFLMIHRIEEDTKVLKNEFNIVKKDVAKNDIIIDYLNNAQNDSRENIEKIVENIESVEDYLQNLKSSVGSMTAEIRNLDSNVAEAVENLFKVNWEFFLEKGTFEATKKEKNAFDIIGLILFLLHCKENSLIKLSDN